MWTEPRKVTQQKPPSMKALFELKVNSIYRNFDGTGTTNWALMYDNLGFFCHGMNSGKKKIFHISTNIIIAGHENKKWFPWITIIVLHILQSSIAVVVFFQMIDEVVF